LLQNALAAGSASSDDQTVPPTGPETAGPTVNRPIPRSFGDYELLEEIAQGGMGTVYKARQISAGRIVALKLIRSDKLAFLEPQERQKWVERFRWEAETVANLDHPHIVPLYQVGENEGQPYFSMKLVEGSSLVTRVKRFLEDPKAAAQLMATVARAVHHAHQRQILHRDLKPHNILLDADGRPHVTDFGLARRTEGPRLGLSAPGAILGTPEYMAPEQVLAERDLTTAVDVYGLGAVLYHLLSGRPPHGGEGVQALMDVLEKDPPRPRSLNPRADRDLETICLKSLQKEPGARYVSAEALAEDLERWLAGEPITARPAGRAERLWRWSRRKPLAAGLYLAVAALLGSLAIGSILFVTNNRISDAHEKAVAARDDALAARQIADTARTQEQGAREIADKAMQREAQAREREAAARRLAEDRQGQLCVTRGEQLLEKGDLLGAMPWFGEALRLAKGDPDRERIHRLRLDELLRRCPRLLLLWHCGQAQEFQVLPNGRHILLFRNAKGVRQYHVWDAVADKPLHGPWVIPSPLNDSFSLGNWSAVSGDNRRFLTVTKQAKGASLVEVRDLANGRLAGARAIRLPGALAHATFSPDGSRIVTASGEKNRQGKYEVRQWDAVTGKNLEPLVLLNFPPLFVQFSPDRLRLITWALSGPKKRIDVSEKREGPSSFSFGNTSFFTPECQAEIWDATTGEKASKAIPIQLLATLWTPNADSSHFIILDPIKEGIRLWDTGTARPLGAIIPWKNRDQVAASLSAQSPGDGEPLFFDSGQITSWQREGQEENTWRWPQANGAQVRFGPDSRFALAISERDIPGGKEDGGQVWDWRNNRALSPLLVLPGASTPMPDTKSRSSRWSFTPEGRRLITVNQRGSSQEIRLWDWRIPDPVYPMPLKGDKPETIRISPEGGKAATFSLGAPGKPNSIQIVDLDTRQPVSKLHPPEVGPGSTFWVIFSGTGKFLLIAAKPANGKGTQMRVWDVYRGKPVGPSWTMPNDAAASAVVSSDGRRVLTSCTPSGKGEDGIELWETVSGKKIAGLSKMVSNHVLGLAISPDSRRAAGLFSFAETVGKNKQDRLQPQLLLWDTTTGKPTLSRSLPDHPLVPIGMHVGRVPPGPVSWPNLFDRSADQNHPDDGGMVPVIRTADLTFSPDGRRLLTAFEAVTHIVDVASGHRVMLAASDQGRLVRVGFSPESRWVVTVSVNGTARVWDAESGKAASSALNCEVDINSTVRFAFSKDSRLLALAIQKGDGWTARAWEVATGIPVTTVVPLQKGPTFVEFAPGDRRLLAPPSNKETTLDVWRLPPADRPADDLIRHAQLLSGRAIDAKGAPVYLDARTIRRNWETLRAKYPGDFHLSDATIRAWHRREAETCLNGEFWWAAIHHLTHLLAAEPADHMHYQDRGRAFSRLGMTGQAIADYSRSITMKPGDWRNWWYRGGAFASQRRYDRAVEDYSRALALQPREWQLWADRGKAHLEAKAWAKAREDYTRALKLNPKAWVLFQSRSFANHELGDKASAVNDLTQAIALGGTEDRICQTEWQFVAALQGLDRQLEKHQTASLLIRRAGLNAKFRKWEQARADCVKAFGLDGAEDVSWNSHYRQAWVTWGRAVAELHGDSSIGWSIEKVLVPAKEFYVTPHRAACLLLWCGDKKEYKRLCANRLKKRVDLQMDYKHIVWTCAMSMESVSTWEALIKEAEHWLILSPNFPGHSLYGAILYRAGKYREAIRQLNQGTVEMEKIPTGELVLWSEGWNWLFLAMTHHKLGHLQEAKQWLAKADARIAELEKQKQQDREKILEKPGAAKEISVYPWWESLELRLLRREAETVLKSPAPKK
jgi:WD40 repeat protein/tRNA A-37 threonylcarbamoyl transferase component Bud32/Tfp pilus assembly protein PilF